MFATMSLPWWKSGMSDKHDVTDEVRDLIVAEAAAGRPLREIARAHEIKTADVTRVIDEAAAEAFSGEQLRRDWFLEAKRLRDVIQTHYARRDEVSSAVVMIKGSERLSALMGLQAQPSYSVQLAISNAQPVDDRTSTQKTIELIERLKAERPLERHVRDGVVWYTPGPEDKTSE
jgi:hypothetical protein